MPPIIHHPNDPKDLEQGKNPDARRIFEAHRPHFSAICFDEFDLPPMLPEQNLLGAILKQAMLDHTMPIEEVEQHDRRTARVFFRGRRNDQRYGTFAYCCHGICNDPDGLMDKVLEFVRRRRKEVGLPDDV